nr:MAG TPA: protein of unknown function (DUF2024) [Caudoviricetes sp.]
MLRAYTFSSILEDSIKIHFVDKAVCHYYFNVPRMVDWFRCRFCHSMNSLQGCLCTLPRFLEYHSVHI